MSKNVVRKANREIINKMHDEIRDKLQVAAYYRNLNETNNVSFFLHRVFEVRESEYILYCINVFNLAEHEFFTWEYCDILTHYGFTSNDIWENKNGKE